MAQGALIRAVTQDDFEDLKAIDEAYAEQYHIEPMLTLGSLNFYARTGHSFASLEQTTMTGFIFAQSVWNGFRPVLQLNRLAVRDNKDQASREALFDALTKSAYDAAVYDIQLLLPSQDQKTLEVAKRKDYAQVDISVLSRTLGSRGQN